MKNIKTLLCIKSVGDMARDEYADFIYRRRFLILSQLSEHLKSVYIAVWKQLKLRNYHEKMQSIVTVIITQRTQIMTIHLDYLE